MTEKIKDIFIRSAKTFWQAALAYFVTAIGTQFEDMNVFDVNAFQNAGLALLIGTVAAGCSAAWNGVFAPFLKKLTGKEKPPDSIA